VIVPSRNFLSVPKAPSFATILNPAGAASDGKDGRFVASDPDPPVATIPFQPPVVTVGLENAQAGYVEL
jgi:hypothetical protein